MKLNLKNPLVFIDLETTGINIGNDRIVEIALLKVHSDGSEEQKVFRINPGIPIPAEATRIHGITGEDVKDAPAFREVARTIAQFIEGCDLAGFNSIRFDIPLLAEEFIRADVDVDLRKHKLVDIQTIYHKMERRTLAAAYMHYCNKEHTGAHAAMNDVRATYEVLQAQLDRYKDAEFEDQNGRRSVPVVNDIEKLSEFSSFDRNVDYVGRIILNDQGVEIFNFGKNKGMPVEQVLREQPGYYSWMMNGDFPLYTKKVLTRIKLRMKER